MTLSWQHFVALTVLVATVHQSRILPGQDSTIAIIDLESEPSKIEFESVIVDKQPGQYLGHPTTCLLDDGKTILCVYPKGHGRGSIVYKRSDDGGKSWSDRLPTPENWKTSKETPTLFQAIGPDGQKRIIMFSGLFPIRMAKSNDDGRTWSALEPIGNFGGIVAMSSVVALKTGPGHYLATFHDDGRFASADSKPTSPVVFSLLRSNSTDGGLTWSTPAAIIQSSKLHLCEAGLVRSPDGKQLACLLRENSRQHASQIMISNDEGNTWTPPKALPKWLWGDRHTAKYLKDGRLFISLRCYWPKTESPHQFHGDWVAWVGRYENLVNGNDGDMFIRLQDNTKGTDCAYPGVEVLPDGTVVTTTYGHWEPNQSPFILTLRLKF